MIAIDLNRDQGLAIIRPKGHLTVSDFEHLTEEVDQYIDERGNLKGIIIYAEKFPGWGSFQSFLRHVKFVKNHHRKLNKVAVVSDDRFLSIAPEIANHFIKAKVEDFDFAELEEAKKWILGTN